MLAEALSWSTAYGVFALVMGGALGLTLLSPEPPAPPAPRPGAWAINFASLFSYP